MPRGGFPPGTGSRYTVALGEAICEELSEGKPLRQICRERGIQWRNIYNWREQFPQFDSAISRARDIGMDAILEDTLHIADTQEPGEILTIKADGARESKMEDMLGHRKLKIDTRLKLLAKWNPKKYGDTLDLTHKGDPAAPVHLKLDGSDVLG